MKLRIILTLLILHFIYGGVQGQNSHKSSFVFPFTSIDKQWEQYKTIKERIDALQIPTSVIHQITTEKLLEVCLQFPYLSDALYSSNITTGIDSNYVTTSIKTPFKSDVPDTYRFIGRDQYFSIEDSVEIAEDISAKYNGAELVRLPTYKYNCHGYAWSVSEGGEKVWIGKKSTTAEDIYWQDGSYVETDNIQNAKKVSYHPLGNHSAIMINQNLFESKWGWGGPLVRHSPNNVPTTYNPYLEKKYYKKTVLKTVNTSSWPADIYIVHVSSNGNNYTKKFLKQ